ncbi:MAG: hypothetical protein DWQ05_15870 [Calditrichaeota bacterium]|nr:MAG: hypothetical protein DWQ05_15870 [Calditrichota bacterium]
MKLKTLFITTILSLVVLNCAQSTLGGEKKPKWVKKRPVTRLFYIGIAAVEKQVGSQDHIQAAKSQALNDLVSEIEVKISGEFINQVSERAGMVEDEVKSIVRAQTKTAIEGYELVDTWDDKKTYWVYYRLSKGLWEEIQREKREKAMRLSLSMYSTGMSKLAARDYGSALTFFSRALQPIQPYPAEPLETTYNGNKIYLQESITLAIQDLVSRIELIPPAGNNDVKMGQTIRRPYTVKTVYNDDSGQQIPVSHLSLKFSFVKGAGKLISTGRSNAQGVALCRLSKVTAQDKIQIVKAEMDVDAFVQQDSVGTITKNTISNMPFPSANIVLSVTGLTAFIEAKELNLGRQIKLPQIEPAIKNSLLENGFTLTDNLSKAEVMIKVDAQSRQGGRSHGISVSYVDLNLSAIDMRSGEEVYKNSLNGAKGFDLSSFDKAGINAFQEAAKKITREMMPQFVAKMQGK